MKHGQYLALHQEFNINEELRKLNEIKNELNKIESSIYTKALKLELAADNIEDNNINEWDARMATHVRRFKAISHSLSLAGHILAYPE